MTTSTPFRDLLHAANLRHGTNGFTSPLKEGVLRIFSPLKIWRLRPGLNPRTGVLQASTLPLDHQSRILPPYDPELQYRPGHHLVSASKRGTARFSKMSTKQSATAHHYLKWTHLHLRCTLIHEEQNCVSLLPSKLHYLFEHHKSAMQEYHINIKCCFITGCPQT